MKVKGINWKFYLIVMLGCAITLVLLCDITSLTFDVCVDVTERNVNVQSRKAFPCHSFMTRLKKYVLLFYSTVSLTQKNEETGDCYPLVDAKGASCTAAVRYSGRVPLPTVALLSSPGSGNTWLRWLIERLTGICTGSVYYDPTVKNAGFQCEDKEPGAIVYKTHDLRLLNATEIILLVRNPFLAVMAEFNRLLTRNQTGHAKFESSVRKRFKSTIREWIWSWVDNSLAALRNSKRLLVVFYENMETSDGLEHELHRIADFLRVRTDHERMQCVLAHSDGPVKRKHTKRISLRNAFRETEIDVMRIIIKAVKDTFAPADVIFPDYDKTELS